MESQVGDKPSPEQNQGPRFGQILEQVAGEQADQPWWLKLGISALWAVGIALATGLVTTIIWAVITLISPNRQFTLRALSDAIFWAAALLMLGGLVAPSTSDLQGDKDKNKRRERPKSLEERRERAMERRIKRVYDPWRWRVWGAAALTFGLAILTGFTTMNG